MNQANVNDNDGLKYIETESEEEKSVIDINQNEEQPKIVVQQVPDLPLEDTADSKAVPVAQDQDVVSKHARSDAASEDDQTATEGKPEQEQGNAVDTNTIDLPIQEQEQPNTEDQNHPNEIPVDATNDIDAPIDQHQKIDLQPPGLVIEFVRQCIDQIAAADPAPFSHFMTSQQLIQYNDNKFCHSPIDEIQYKMLNSLRLLRHELHIAQNSDCFFANNQSFPLKKLEDYFLNNTEEYDKLKQIINKHYLLIDEHQTLDYFDEELLFSVLLKGYKLVDYSKSTSHQQIFELQTVQQLPHNENIEIESESENLKISQFAVLDVNDNVILKQLFVQQE